MSDATNNPPEAIAHDPLASGEIDAVKHEKSSEILKEGNESIAKGRSKAKPLVVGLAAAALLVVGGGAVYAQGQGSSMMGGDNVESGTDGMGGMMNGGRMGPMMGGTMQGGCIGGMTGSFDEEQPFDLQFIDRMTMHHEGAIMSSEHMISDSERPELRQLANNIQLSQSEQIEQMQAWRKEWYPDAGQTFGMPAGMMDEMMGADGMMQDMMGGSMQETMGGNTTDEMFLRMMIPHHQTAVDVAERALAEAEHPELEKLAQTIIDEQSAEIELMRGYLNEIEAAGRGNEAPTTRAGEAHHGH